MARNLVASLLVWLVGVMLAHAQAPRPAPAGPSRLATSGLISLGPETPALPLAGRSLYWIDPTAAATPTDVEAAGDSLPWAVRERSSQYDIDGKALWLRFDAVSRDDTRRYLELGSSGLDRAQLFYRGRDGSWVTQEAGDTRPVSEWPLPGRVPTFELAHATGEPVRYFLRVEHARVNFGTPIVLYDQGALLASREREQFLLGAYFGLATLIAFVSLANALVYRDRNFGTYAVYVATLSLGQVAYLGVGAQHLWNDWLRWNEMATFLLPGVTTAAALWFARTVTEPSRFSARLDLAVWALIFAVLSAVAVDTFVVSRTSFAVLMALTVLGLLVGLTLIGVVWAKGEDPYIRLIALGFLPVVIMAMFPVARGLNLIPASVLTRYGLSIGAALEMPLLFYALNLRGSRRREAAVRAAALSRTDPMTGLAHTRSLLQRMEGALIRCRSQKHACALMAVQLANHAALVSEFGRDAGERALVVAASVLRGAITDIDLAARIDDHEFAVLLEGPTTPAIATECAQQVVARGLHQSSALPPTAVLRFHVAVAMLPDKDFDAAGSLQWVREAVHAMHPEARRAIRSLNF